MTGFAAVTGGCLCGAVRYEVTAPALDVYHCHCSICRKCQGALYATNAVVPRDAFRITRGEGLLRTFSSSEVIHRRFCGRCGSHVCADIDPFSDRIWYLPGALDDGAGPGGPAAEARHIFWESRAGWYEPMDGRPRLHELGEETS